MTTRTFRAGVGRVDITPPLTAPHASWGAQVHVLPDGVESALWATALVVDDGTTRAAWIDLDIVSPHKISSAGRPQSRIESGTVTKRHTKAVQRYLFYPGLKLSIIHSPAPHFPECT